MTINPIPDYSPIQHPQRMTVSNTMTLVTDRGANPNGFTSPFRCGFQIGVPSAWGVTSPTFPTRDLVVTEVPLGMHHLGITMTMTINPITDYNPIEHPCGMTVSNTMTLVTDRSTKPKGFSFALCCNPSAWVVTSLTFPTGGLFVTEVPHGMHHLGTDNSENDIDLGR